MDVSILEGKEVYCLDQLALRDVEAIKYNKDKDVLLIKLKTPLTDEDGKSPTYELVRIKDCVHPDTDELDS